MSWPDALQMLYAGSGAAAGLAVGLAVAWVLHARAAARAASLEAELKAQQRLERERELSLELAAEKLAATFDRLADRQFQSHSETFLKLARENLGAHTARAKGELEAREQAIEALLRPIRETMRRTEEQLHELDKARRESHGSITAQLEAVAASQQTLGAETRNLVQALCRPEIRGQWGEITLHRLVELAGMVEHCDYRTQTVTPTESGTIRPDMVVHLPEGRQLIVDVKTPLDAYLDATEAADDGARKAALVRHAAIVAERIRELSAKSYWAQFDQSPEFAILFIPGDQILSAALAERPGLLDDALSRNIILATPTSLVALLKAVAYGWQQVTLADNAHRIRDMAVELYERLQTFTAHLARTGKALGDSVKAYNQSIGSLERMVMPSARRFTELGVHARTQIEEPGTVETAPRAPSVDDSAPEPAAGAASPGDAGSTH
jgi:DNA recombination protein RmuC